MRKAVQVGGIDAILFRYNFRRYGDRDLNLALDACKKAEYEAAGVAEYFILHSSAHRAFHRLGQGGVCQPIEPDEGGVVRSVVLPGFQFRLDDERRLDADPR